MYAHVLSAHARSISLNLAHAAYLRLCMSLHFRFLSLQYHHLSAGGNRKNAKLEQYLENDRKASLEAVRGEFLFGCASIQTRSQQIRCSNCFCRGSPLQLLLERSHQVWHTPVPHSPNARKCSKWYVAIPQSLAQACFGVSE